MEGSNPLTMIEWLSPYIWPWKEPILSPCRNGYSVLHWVILVTDQVPPFLEWQLPLHLSYSTEWPALISVMKGATLSPWQNGPALISNLLVRMAMDLSTHIWHGRNQSSHHDRMAQPLHLTMEGTNPLTMLEWVWVSSLSLGGNLDLEDTKSLPEVLEL